MPGQWQWLNSPFFDFAKNRIFENMELTKQKFRIKGGKVVNLYATPGGKCPLIDRNNRVREFSPQMAGRILGIIAHMERERGNAKTPAKITPHRFELDGWREMTAAEIEVWAAGAETRIDTVIISKKNGSPERLVFPDGLEMDNRPVSRTTEQDAEKDRLRQLLAAKEAELEELRAMKAEQVNPPTPVEPSEPEVVETPVAEDQPKPEPKKRGRKRKTSTSDKEGGEA